jgi:ABC-type polysaccharide/polyol phosphate transport system ATPase subunit
MSDNEFIVRVEGISKNYYSQNSFNQNFKDFIFSRFTKKKTPVGKVEALKDVSFDLKRGDSLGIIGSNGAGKSTLLKILSGVTTPTSGKIILNGTVRSVLDVGTGFHPDLTGKENVYLSGEILGLSKSEIDEKYEEIIEFSEISEFINTPVKYYSSGMYLRLAFSTIAFLHADILVFDEAISAGDAGFKRKLVNRMKILRESGVTMIIVSHNFNEIFSLCPNIILLEKGSVKTYGPAYKVAAQYLEQLLIQNQAIDTSVSHKKTDLEQLNKSHSAGLKLEDSLIPDYLLDKKLMEEQQKLKLRTSGLAATHLSKLNVPDKKWGDTKTAPGNNHLQVVGACLKTKGKKIGAPMYVDEPLVFQLRINKLTDKLSHIAITVFGNTENNLIAFSTTLHNKTNECRLSGQYTLEFQIPANTFNRGIFEIKLVLLDEGPLSTPKIEDLLIFKMEYPDNLPDRELMEQYPGPLRFDIPCVVTQQD